MEITKRISEQIVMSAEDIFQASSLRSACKKRVNTGIKADVSAPITRISNRKFGTLKAAKYTPNVSGSKRDASNLSRRSPSILLASTINMSTYAADRTVFCCLVKIVETGVIEQYYIPASP